MLTAASAALALTLPVTASARTKTVYEGPPPLAKTLITRSFAHKYAPDVDDYFLHTVVINQGDTVKWINGGFHTVDIPAHGAGDLPLLLPGATVTGDKDAAGNPFWFNGHVPSLGFNPQLLAPSGGNTYNGSARIESGLPLGPPAPFKVKFTKAGTYKYFCDVHPGMIGFVVVRRAGKTVPTASQDASALKLQVKTDIAIAKTVAKTKPPTNKVSLGAAGPNGVEDFAMFPTRLKVKRGTVVTFLMSKNTREVHTATFGPRGYLTALAASLKGPAPAQHGWYPSDPGVISLLPTSHGNGFANTGVLDRDADTPTVPASGKVKFTKAGTYRFICLVHTDMVGTIVVK